MSAMEVSIANLKRRLQVEEGNLALSKALMSSREAEDGEQSAEKRHWRHLQTLVETACTPDYRSQSEILCRDIMSKSFLAFYEAQIEFSPCNLRTRILQVEALPEYSAREEYRNYVVSLLKLEYHYLFPSAENKFDVWSLLEMRMKLRNRLQSDGRYDIPTLVCEKLIEMHPDVPMRINFTDGTFLDVPLHSTIQWVSWKMNGTFTSPVPLKLYCGHENYSAKGGKLFDLDVVAKTVFSSSSSKCTTETRNIKPNLYEVGVIGGQKLTIYEVKQLISDGIAPPHLLTISNKDAELSDDVTLEGHNIVQNATLHAAVRNDGLEYLTFFGAATSPPKLHFRSLPAPTLTRTVPVPVPLPTVPVTAVNTRSGGGCVNVTVAPNITPSTTSHFQSSTHPNQNRYQRTSISNPNTRTKFGITSDLGIPSSISPPTHPAQNPNAKRVRLKYSPSP